MYKYPQLSHYNQSMADINYWYKSFHFGYNLKHGEICTWLEQICIAISSTKFLICNLGALLMTLINLNRRMDK